MEGSSEMVNRINRVISIFLISILLLASFLPVNQVKAEDVQIPEDALQYDGHFYKVYSNICNTWDEAKEFCEYLGGHLAVISSQEENDVLFDYIISQGVETAYFGFSDLDNEGKWLWVTNEYNSYTNWHSGEPNSESGEDYAEFYWKFPDGTWNDGNFATGTESDSRNFICEWDGTEITNVSYASTHGWCLANNRESFGYGPDYRISMSQYYKVYGISLATLIESSLSNISKWNGNCFGLSLLSLAQYYHLADLSSCFHRNGDNLYDFGYESIYKDSQGEECFSISNNKEALDTIERAMISQDSAEFKECEIFKGDSDFSDLLEFMSSDQARPIMVTFRSSMSGHAMVLTPDIKPTRLDGEDTDWYCISAYDPNAPVNSDLLTNPMSYYERGNSYLLVNPTTEEWRYYVKGSVHMINTYYSFDSFNIRGQSIWYYDISKLDPSYFTSTLNLWHYRIQLQIFGADVTVYDANGNVLLKVEDNQIKSLSNKCDVAVRFGASGEDGAYVFYTDVPKIKVKSSSATILGMDDAFIMSGKIDSSNEVKINFDSKQILTHGTGTNGQFEICAQDHENHAVRLTGDNVEGDRVSLQIADGVATIGAEGGNDNLSVECENIDEENVREGEVPDDQNDGRVYCQAPANWSQCYAYFWDEEYGEFSGKWPGILMTKEATGRWSAQIPLGATKVIFNNGSASQTDDLEIPVDDKINYVVADNTWEVLDENLSSTNKLYCQAPENWSDCYVYFWDEEYGEFSGKWPGIIMTKETDGCWSSHIPLGATMVIFNDGSASQTDDLEIPADGKLKYVVATNTWETPEDHTADSPITPEPVRLMGDVNGDGYLNVGDVARLYSHIRNIKPLTDPASLNCADFTNDGQINIGDVSKLYAHIRGAN